MKKIVTAMNEPKLNQTLKQLNEYEIITADITYQEALLEIIEKIKNIDIIILSELLTGKLKLVELIKKIQNENSGIKIIVILEKENREKINELKNIKIENILIHNKTTIEETIKIIKNINTEKNIEKEIEEIKKLIIENKKQDKKIINIKFIEEVIKNKIKNKTKLEEKNYNKNNNKVISMSGTSGAGKSIIAACLAKELKKEKIIILDFDLFNNDLKTIFGKKKKLKTKNNLNQIKIKINKKLDLICGESLLLPDKKIDINELNNLIEELKKQYAIIIIDTSCECFLNYNKLILEKSDQILFLTEANITDIKKSIRLLRIFQEEWKIKKEKIKLIFNKYNRNSIDEKILKTIFYEYEILGKINFNYQYNLLINKNMHKSILKTKIEEEHKKIIHKILNKKIGGKKYGERINVRRKRINNREGTE